ncbi:maleylpyruvate isomerase family mycothiol-dependent enzyme [Actinoplanes sp. N902-109]|uniref:maleylpyruvate isomerase family mycothiol-dependent enzyme n=1 Tax=Actinoplanes sp. (strain N902-109) TaxID=649831 RepID=UPI0003293F37|nr:maleylpyruvate isomerase family mycothiol-dependent enzyme [Actinoplanes sp. N902-109]AGL17444.1 putative mycothiol-dependent maleylpyruvate isomerase [Actinoplanes sp. N902-109]
MRSSAEQRTALLADIAEATTALLHTAARLDDPALRAPSLLPGWTRGHVLTHLARNADGGTRLLTGGREYPSPAARAAAIEAGSTRPAAEQLHDLRTSADRFAAACHARPHTAWDTMLTWTTGRQRPAWRTLPARLSEVHLHHTDLDAGYRPHDWPAGFVTTQLATVVSAFAGRPGVPGLRLHATDTGRTYRLGGPGTPRAVTGPQAALLAWLTGRSDGTELAPDLPALPFLY